LSKAASGGSQRASAKRRVTLTDVAVAAGVSVTTASNVVNGRLQMMSAATRARVENAMRVLKYRPDEGARSLRLAQKRTIGLIVVDDSPRFLTDAMNTNIIAMSAPAFRSSCRTAAASAMNPGAGPER
jgi:LacI family transcriptional regulator